MRVILAALFFFSSVGWSLSFDKACAPAQNQIIIGGVGDFLMHSQLQRAGNQSGYHKLWKGVQYRINQVDLMYGNLETPVMPGSKYTGYPQFNAPPMLLESIKATGFDVLSTANNHTLDRRKVGADKTIEQIQNYGLNFTGSRRSGTRGSFATIVSRGGFRVGFVACTYGLNGFVDSASQVLECYSEKQAVLNEIRALKSRVDAVIVTPHWGSEYKHKPNAREVKFARELIDSGATAVIGTHPHVIQPIEKYKNGFIAYSTGNFISSQGGIKKVGLMLFLGFSKANGKTWINGVRYAPTYMVGSSAGVYFLDNTEAERSYRRTVDQVMNDRHGYLGSNERLVTNPECY